QRQLVWAQQSSRCLTKFNASEEISSGAFEFCPVCGGEQGQLGKRARHGFLATSVNQRNSPIIQRVTRHNGWRKTMTMRKLAIAAAAVAAISTTTVAPAEAHW